MSTYFGPRASGALAPEADPGFQDLRRAKMGSPNPGGAHTSKPPFEAQAPRPRVLSRFLSLWTPELSISVGEKDSLPSFPLAKNRRVVCSVPFLALAM